MILFFAALVFTVLALVFYRQYKYRAVKYVFAVSVILMVVSGISLIWAITRPYP